MADPTVEVPVEINTGELSDVVRTFNAIEGSAKRIAEQFAGSARSLAPLLSQMTQARAVLANTDSNPADILRANNLLKEQNDAHQKALELIQAQRQELKALATDRAREREAQLATVTADGRTVAQARSTNTSVNDTRTVRNTTNDSVQARLVENEVRINQRNARYGAYASAEEYNAAQATLRLQKESADLQEKMFALRSRMTKQWADQQANAARQEKADAESVFQFRARMTAQRFKAEEDERRNLTKKEIEEAAAKAKAIKDRERAEYNTVEARVARGNEYRQAAISSNGGADFFAFQSQIAMNYQIWGQMASAIRGSMQALIEFDDVLARFQAITSTTNSEMKNFRQGLLDIASTSRYSVRELTEAAIALGQTGLSATDVLKALPAVRDLATASGSTLQQSVEAITGVLGAFNMQAARSSEIADILVGALNKTKLTMDQLQLGIQYAGNVARDAGVSFVELTAVIGGIAQAGVKSGSTIGTGTRQLIQELIAPSDKLKTVLRDLGITLDQVDIKSNGLTGVLENLRAKGFTTADALRALDLRAASAFAALVGQSDKVKQLQEELLLSTSASEAASKAGESLSATFTRMANSLFALTDKAFGPFITAAKVGTEGITAFASAMGILGPVLPAVGAGITTIAVSLAAIRLGGLIAGLASLPAILAALSGPIGAIGLGVGALAYIASLSSAADTLAERLDKLKGAANEFTSQQSSTETSIKSISSNIQTLMDRQDKLDNDSNARRTAIIEMQKAFGALGLDIKNTSASTLELIESLQKLRSDMQKQLPDNLAKQIENTRNQIQLLREQQILSESQDLNKQSAGQLRNQVVRTFGPQFGAVADAASYSRGIDPKDAMGSSGALRKLVEDQKLALSNERDPLVNAQTMGTLDTEGKRRLVIINEKLDLLNVVSEKLSASVSRMTNIQGLNQAQERLKIQRSADEIKSTDEFRTLLGGTERADGEFDRRSMAILRQEGGGLARKNSMLELTRERQGVGKELSDLIDQYREKLSSEGYSKEAIQAALAEVQDKVTAFNKSVTKVMEEVSTSVNAEATFMYQAQRRETDQALRTLRTRLAGKNNNDDDISSIEGQIAEVLARRKQIENALLDLKRNNPDNVDNSPQLKEARASLDQQLKEREAEFTALVSERRRKLQEDLLRVREDSLNSRKNNLNAQLGEIDKLLSDPKTTADEAKKLADAAKGLLKQLEDVMNDVSKMINDRKAAGMPGGSIPNSGLGGTYDSGDASTSPVLRAMLNAIKSVESGGAYDIRNGGERFDTSGLHPGRTPGTGGTSSASGAYQFTYSTWQEFAGGAAMTPLNQDMAAIKLMLTAYKQNGGGNLVADLEASGLTPEILSKLKGRWEGFKTNPSKAMDEYTRSVNRYRTGSDLTADQVSQERNAQDRAKNEQQRLNKEKGYDLKVDERARTEALASLLRADKEIATRLQSEQNAVRRSVDAEQASIGNNRIIASLVQLAEKSVQKDELRKDGNTDRDTIIQTALNSAQRAAITAADDVAKKVTEQYDQQIRQVQAKIATADLNKDKPGFGQIERDQLQEQLRQLQEKKKVEVEYAETKLKLAELDKAAAAFNASDVFAGKELLLIDQQREALRRKMAEYTPQIVAREKAAASSPSYLTGLQSGLRDFSRSRGITDNFGRLVDDVQVARKALADSLNSIGNNFDTFFVNLATGSKKGKEAFAELAKGILTDMAKIASKAVTNEIMKLIFGSLLSTGSTGGSATTSLFDGLAGLFGGRALGGPIRRAGGGSIPFRDSVPVLAMEGEYMLRKSAVDAIGVDKLDQMNALGNTVLNDNQPQKYVPVKGGGNATANVYIIPKDEPPPMGPNDIIHVIGDDISRGGPIKQLIKKVQAT